MNETLLHKIGGEPALDQAVTRLYDIILKDDRINQYFNNLDIKHQIRNMIAS